MVTTLFMLSVTAKEAPTVLLVCETEQEVSELCSLAQASSIHCETILREQYDTLPEKPEYVITTIPSVAQDAIEAGIIPLCIGNAFEAGNDITFQSLDKASIQLEWGNYTQTTKFLTDIKVISDYQGQTVGSVKLTADRQYPFAVKGEDAWYIPWYDINDLSAFIVAEIMGDYVGIEDAGGTFVLIDNIYPFSDLNQLSMTIDELYRNSIPFIVRIMPIYDNLDYPAYQRYLNILQYAQSKNGTIVIHDPLIVQTEIEREPLSVRMERFYSSLEQQNIHYRHMASPPLTVRLDLLKNIQSLTKNFGRLSFDIMIPLELENSIEQLEQMNQKWLNFDNYQLRFTTEQYRYYKESITEDYKYIPEQEKTFENFFAIGNQFLIVVVLISLVIFVVLMIAGYILYRRKYY